jgi:glycosyltransferase involved in cell wall biosynthesis
MSGLVADPDNEEEWLAQARKLAADADLRRALGVQGRLYAEQNFDISRIATTFEDILLRSRRSHLAADSAGAVEVNAGS